MAHLNSILYFCTLKVLIQQMVEFVATVTLCNKSQTFVAQISLADVASSKTCEIVKIRPSA